MSTASMLAWRLAKTSMTNGGSRGGSYVEIKRGADAIFGDGPYPRTMTDFIGQGNAREQLLTHMKAAMMMDKPLPHTLLASGSPGIGKTSLAKLIAAQLDVGYVEIGGTITVKDVKPILESMKARDVLFIDEIHRMVSSGKKNAEWLLQLMQDGVLVLPTGVVSIAPITIIAATTDAQKLPQTILDRFVIQPVLEAYSPEEGVQIAKVTAKRMGMDDLPEAQYHRIAMAADYNPRIMGRLLTTVRDILLGSPACEDPVKLALSWTGHSADGLTDRMQDYLLTLLAYGGTCGLPSLKAVLGETDVSHTEQTLIQKGYAQVTSKGRELTRLGIERATALLEDNHPQEVS